MVGLCFFFFPSTLTVHCVFPMNSQNLTLKYHSLHTIFMQISNYTNTFLVRKTFFLFKSMITMHLVINHFSFI
jgi:hypothetical protein